MFFAGRRTAQRATQVLTTVGEKSVWNGRRQLAIIYHTFCVLSTNRGRKGLHVLLPHKCICFFGSCICICICLSKRREMKPTKGTKATAKRDGAKVSGEIHRRANRKADEL